MSPLAKILRALEVPALIAVPIVLTLCAVFQFEQTAFLSLLVVVLSIVVFFAGYESSNVPLRLVMPTVVLAALATAGRILFAAVPDIKPVSAICVIAGAAFGKRTGFMVGALTALASNMFFGQGPWTPWQMYAWGMLGYLAGVFASRGWLEKTPALYALGAGGALFFGFILNTWYLIGFIHPLTLPAAIAAYVAALPMDIVHAIATVAFLAVLYAPWKKKLARIQRKFAIGDLGAQKVAVE